MDVDDVNVKTLYFKPSWIDVLKLTCLTCLTCFNRNAPVAPWNESEVPQASDMIALFTDTLNCLQAHLNGKMQTRKAKKRLEI